MCARVCVVMQMLRGCKQYVDGLQNIDEVAVGVGATEKSSRADPAAAAVVSSNTHTQPAEIMTSPVVQLLSWLLVFWLYRICSNDIAVRARSGVLRVAETAAAGQLVSAGQNWRTQ